MYGRESLLRQCSNTRDKSENEDTTKSIIKDLEVKKGSVLIYEFRASHEGVVGCIFKFVDNSTFYTFEIGGSSDMTKRFFRIRRQLKGAWTTIKQINTNAEISFLPFFGYEVNTWYSVEVITEQTTMIVSIALMGLTQRMKIMTVNDDKIARGGVGFSTSGTEAVFGEITLRPPPIEYSKYIFLIP